MPAEPTIRDLNHDDLSALLALYEHLHPGDAAPDAGKAKMVWADLVNDPRAVYLGAEVDGVLVASCVATVIPNLTRGARPYAVIENVITHPNYRRRGLGRALMQAILERCWRTGCYKVMLQSAAGRGEAHAFYEAIGFDPHAKQAFVARPPEK